MRILILILLPYLSIFLETTLFSHFSIRGMVPDLVLIFVSFFAIVNGSRSGFAYGFLCGLFEDLYLGRFIGMNALAKAITAYLVGKLEMRVFKDNILVGFAGVIAATVINEAFLLILAALSWPKLVLGPSMVYNLMGQVAYNSLLSIPFYIFYYKSSSSGMLRIHKFRR